MNFEKLLASLTESISDYSVGLNESQRKFINLLLHSFCANIRQTMIDKERVAEAFNKHILKYFDLEDENSDFPKLMAKNAHEFEYDLGLGD